MSMYPDEQIVEINGEQVSYPGLEDGKFSDGDFADPSKKPSFIPSQSLNLILDNLDALITALGGESDNFSIDQLAALFSSQASPNRGMSRDVNGRSQIAAPVEESDIANRGWVHPVGSYYVQYPDAASNDDATEFPVSQRPATLFGGTWAEQWATESVFFRTRGNNSDSGRTNGYQTDQFQSHAHYINDLTDIANRGGTGANTAAKSAGADAAFDTLGPISDGTNGTPRIGTETRPMNRRIKIWKRTA